MDAAGEKLAGGGGGDGGDGGVEKGRVKFVLHLPLLPLSWFC